MSFLHVLCTVELCTRTRYNSVHRDRHRLDCSTFCAGGAREPNRDHDLRSPQSPVAERRTFSDVKHDNTQTDTLSQSSELLTTRPVLRKGPEEPYVHSNLILGSSLDLHQKVHRP